MSFFLVKNVDSYNNRDSLKDFIFHTLNLSGKTRLSGKKVLIKPNFLKPSYPDKAIITHPDLLVAAFEVLKDCGAKIYLGDSPGFGSLESVLKKAEIFPCIAMYDVKVADFSAAIKIKSKNSIVFKEFDLPEVIFECDEIFNIPKLKTHQMMLLTLAVKNLYGCIFGAKKIKLHLTAGENHELFATLLLDIYLAIKPSLNILDGILGMEGDGPASGEVKKFRLLAASDDALILDFEVAKLLSVNPEKVPYLNVALKHKLIPEWYDTYDSGYVVEKKQIKLPKSHAVNFSIPKFLHKIAKRYFLAYPDIGDICKGCRVCLNHCPVSAITMKKNKANIDKTKCIRCYCCQELCEHNAVKVKR